jgi:hypothetical protein
MLWLQQRNQESKREETEQEMAAEFFLSVLIIPQVTLSFASVQSKARCGFLSPLKTHRVGRV